MLVNVHVWYNLWITLERLKRKAFKTFPLKSDNTNQLTSYPGAYGKLLTLGRRPEGTTPFGGGPLFGSSSPTLGPIAGKNPSSTPG